MIGVDNVSGISHIIELAIAPAFLLVGIGHILVVLTNRLGRITDRARALEIEYEGAERDAEERAMTLKELMVLDRRMTLSHWSISLCTASALFVCLVVMLLFLSDALDFEFAGSLVGLFIVTMSTLIGGLVLFFIEVSIATRHIGVRRDLLRRN
ncbi:MAG: hypothetical protein Tsb008_11020 [Rhodothalassiaceae bacterium]